MMNEQSYDRGHNAAYINVMTCCLRSMGFDNAEAANVAHVAWIKERQAVVNVLRDLCETFGDNDWPDELHLGDVIEKHLAPHIRMACPIKKTMPLFHELSGGICNRE